MNSKKQSLDPLSLSHLSNPMNDKKTVCGLDVNSSLDIKDTIDGVTCNECQAVFTKPENYRQPEQQPAEQPEPESADQLIHWSIFGDLPACMSATAKVTTVDRSKVNCSECRVMIGTAEKMEKSTGGGLNIVVLNIPDKTINTVLGNLFSSMSVK